MSNLRYIAPIYDRLGGSSALPVAFSMYAVGGRTQAIGVHATWWTTQGAQSQIDWAITEGFSPPPLSEYETTPWTEDFVNNHDIPFPEVRMNHFHWFFARSRNAAGQVLQSPRRGIYVVPSEFELTSFNLLTEVDFSLVQSSLGLTLSNSRILSSVSVNNDVKVVGILLDRSFSEESIDGQLESLNASNLTTEVTIV